MRLFLSIFLKIRGQQIISITIQISILPARLHQLHWSVSDMFSIHFLERIQKISGIGKRHKAIAPRLSRPSIPNNPGHLEGRIPPKHTPENLIIDLVTQITAKYPVIILGPVLHSLVLPNLSCCFSQCFALWFILFLYPFVLLRHLLTINSVFLFLLSLLNIRRFV